MFSQPGTGEAALDGWNVHGSRCVFASPQEAMVAMAQSSAAFKLGVPVTRGRIALEIEAAEIYFRNVEIRELE